VTLFGKNYSASASSTPIVIHLDTRDGAAIASFPPTAILNGSAVIPAGTAAGTHTLVATQYTAAGNAVSGTPGRASVSVSVAARTSADGVAAGPAATASSGTAAATPAAVTPASPAASAAAPAAVASAPAQSVAAGSVSSTGSAAPAANVASTPSASASAAASAPGAAASAAQAVSAPDAAAAAPSASVAGPASVNVGLLPASSHSTSILPGLSLVAGLALVLLGLVAFLKSGRSILGRSFSPLAG
jgi:hypothetical protein